MIVLTLEPGEAEKLAEGAPTLQRRYGMPIDPAPYAAAGLLGARLPRGRRRAPATRPEARGPLLRRLRVRTMLGGLLDDPSLLAAAASDVGLDPSALAAWCATAEVEAAPCRRTSTPRAPRRPRRARSTTSSAGRRSSAATPPRATRSGATRTARSTTLPGFHPVEAYEAAIANLAPELVRRPKPESVADVLAWAGHPLATAEVAAIAQLDATQARVELSRVAQADPGRRRLLLVLEATAATGP